MVRLVFLEWTAKYCTGQVHVVTGFSPRSCFSFSWLSLDGLSVEIVIND